MRDAFRNICDALLDSAVCLPSVVRVYRWDFTLLLKQRPRVPVTVLLDWFTFTLTVNTYNKIKSLKVLTLSVLQSGDDYYTLVFTLKFAADLHFILTFLLFCVVFLITSLSSSSSNNVCDWCRQQGSFWVMWPHFNVTVWSRWNQKLLEWKCESKNIAHNLKLWPRLIKAR